MKEKIRKERGKETVNKRTLRQLKRSRTSCQRDRFVLGPHPRPLSRGRGESDSSPLGEG